MMPPKEQGHPTARSAPHQTTIAANGGVSNPPQAARARTIAGPPCRNLPPLGGLHQHRAERAMRARIRRW